MKRNELRRLERDKTTKKGSSRRSKQNNITTMWESGKATREKIMTGCLIACALIWTLVFLLDFVGKINSVGLVVMHGVFALAWISGAFVWIVWKHRKS